MENIQRELAKEIAALQPLRSLRKNRRWTLLLVGDHDRSWPFDGSAGWRCWCRHCWFWLPSSAACFYYFYLHARQANGELQQSLEGMQRQIVELRREKEILMAQAVVSRTKTEKPPAQSESKPPEKAAEDRQKEIGKKEPPPEAKGARQSGPVLTGTDGKALADSPTDGLPVAPGHDSKVSAEELKVFHDADGGLFKAQFVLRNSRPDNHSISGYTAVILKKSDMPPDKWLPLPSLKLVQGRPGGDKVGQYFSIARFKTVGFSVKSGTDPRQFDSATIYVFDENKKLLLEKNFSIDIQVPAAAPNP
jgi:hypothetical protein